LYERAVDLGVSFKFNSYIGHTSYTSSQNIIAADGPTSIMSSIFGLPRIRRLVMAGKFFWGNDNTKLDEHLAHIFIDPDIIPGFFGWVIPRSESVAEYGLGVDMSYGVNVITAFKRFISRHAHLIGMTPDRKDNPFDTLRKSINFAVIPISVREKVYHLGSRRTGTPNLIVVGDAAGHTKATTGGGVVLNTQIGYIAGKYYDSPLIYDMMWKKDFLLTFKLHSHMNKLFHKSKQNLRRIMYGLKERGLEQFLELYGDMDYPHRFISRAGVGGVAKATYLFGPVFPDLLL